MKRLFTAALLAFVCFAAAPRAFAQATADFSTYQVTKTIAEKTFLPGACALGELTELVQAAPYAPVVYICGFSNNWNPVVGTGGSGLTDPGTNGILKRIAFDGTGIASAADIAALFGCSSGTPLLTYTGGCAANTGSGGINAIDTCADATGSTTAYVCTSAQGQATTNGKAFLVKPQATNTASATLTINTVIWTLKKQGTNLIAGDFIGGQWYLVVSDGVYWNVVSRLGNDGTGGGGTGNAAAYTPVSFSATPAFTATSNTVSAFSITLTGNVTGSTLASASTGQAIIFKVCQDSTGSRTFAWPSNFTGAGVVDATASGCSNQAFVYDGTSAIATGTMYVTGVAGSAITLFGSTSGFVRLQPTAAAGSYTLTIPSAVCAAHNWWNVASCAQPADADLAFTNITTGNATTVAHGFLPILPNDATKFMNGMGAWSVPPGGGSITYYTGGGDFLFGTPSYSNSPAAIVPAGGGGGGEIYMVINKFPTMLYLDYNVATASGAGTGALFGIFTPDLTTALCVTAVASGTKVTATGPQFITFASGTAVSSGVCSIPIGQPVAYVQTADNTSLQLAAYGSLAFAMRNGHNAKMAGYTGSGVSTGTGGSITFSSLTGITWTPLPDGSSYFQPIIFIEN
jgi:hypothetical protein